MERTLGCSPAKHTGTPECTAAIIDFQTKKLSSMGEAEFIHTTGCRPPCTLNYYKFEAPFITQVPAVDREVGSEYNMVRKRLSERTGA